MTDLFSSGELTLCIVFVLDILLLLLGSDFRLTDLVIVDRCCFLLGLSVHLTCGIWGTLAVGIFSSDHQFLTQLIGVSAYAVFCIISSIAIFYTIQSTIGLRASEEEVLGGLDLGEHEMEAYACFQIFTVE